MLVAAAAPSPAPGRIGGGPDAAERCGRAAALLAPAAAAALPERGPGDEPWPAKPGRLPDPGPEWLALEGCRLQP